MEKNILFLWIRKFLYETVYGIIRLHEKGRIHSQGPLWNRPKRSEKGKGAILI